MNFGRCFWVGRRLTGSARSLYSVRSFTASAATLVNILALVLAPAAAAPPPKHAPPNVILITLDTVRADHLGCYGAKNVQTPTLDALAHDGVLFERAISQVPLTWPSHAAILTGTYPFQNGVQDFTGQPLSSRFRTVAQDFKTHGYATGAVVSAFVLDRSWGLARGFDYYDDAFSAETLQKKDLGLVDRRANESVDHAIAWLAKTQRRPFFFWLHLYDPHSPYDPPEPYRSQYRDHLYDGEIAFADHELGRLVAWLKAKGIYDQTAIVFLSDHGESLGEHGEDEHGFFVYNATVHIPLIVKPPGPPNPSRRITHPVETVAVAPTLLAVSGIPADKQFVAARLFPVQADDAEPAYSETFYPFSSFGWSPLHSLQTERYHYIDAPEPELYDLSADPQEQHNLASQQTATVATFQVKLKEKLAQASFLAQTDHAKNPTASLSPDAQSKLRALGYVGYRAPVSAADLAAGLPDPKGKLWEFNAILRAQDSFHHGNYAEGERLLSPVQEKDPQMYIVPFMLGEAALRREDWAGATAALERSLQLNPGFDQAMTGLARALLAQGKAEEAKPWVEKAIQFNPQNYRALHQLGVIQARDNPAQAIVTWQRAIAVQMNFPLLHRDLGMLYFRQQKYSQAAVALSKAAALGLNDAPLFNFLGISYSRTGELQKAVAEYRRALDLDPSLAEAYLNLGFAYHRLGREKEAAAQYSQACRLQANLCGQIGKQP